MNRGMAQYKSVGLEASVQTASPHQLIAMLLRGALEAVARAEGSIERGDIGTRSTQINKAIAIVLELKGSLDSDKGGEVAANLDQLYGFVVRELTLANRENSVARLKGVNKIIVEIADGWGSIPPEHHRQID